MSDLAGGKAGIETLGSEADELKKEVKEKPLCVATFPPSRLWASAAPFQTLLVSNTKASEASMGWGAGGVGTRGGNRGLGEGTQVRRPTSLSQDFLLSPSPFPETKLQLYLEGGVCSCFLLFPNPSGFLYVVF